MAFFLLALTNLQILRITFLIGIGLMVMVPYYLDGFDSAFRFTSAAGWFMGSFIMMYGDREPYSEYLKKLRW